MVRVEGTEPPAGGVTEAGLKEHVAVAGQFGMLRATAELKLFSDVTVTE